MEEAIVEQPSDDSILLPGSQDIPTIDGLIKETRLLIFRTALLQTDPHRWLVRYFLRTNRHLRAGLQAAMDRRLDRITQAAPVRSQ